MAENLKQTIEFQAKGIAKLKKQYKELEQRTKGLEGATTRAGGSLGGLVAKLGLTTVALYGTMRAISSVVSVGREFTKNMSNVAAISGATADQLKELESNARQLGATTVFTASQVAELQTEFAKLGFTSKQIQGVTKDTLALAAASGADLATSAAVAGQTLRAFGLNVSETSRVTDTMALSFSSSALDMEKFTNSMQYVAPIAKQVGISVEGTTAMLGALANAGISGSMAGTSLRKILLELGNENSALTKKIGFSVKTSDDMVKAFEILREKGIGVAEAKDLVGQRAISAFNILLEGTGTVKELTGELENAGGAAQKMADVQLDNLDGSLTLLNSAMEGLGLRLFEFVEGPLRGMVDGFTEFATALDEEAIKSYSIAFGAVAAAVIAYNSAIITARLKTIAFQAALVKTGWGALIVGAGLAVGKLIDMTNVFSDLESEMREVTEEAKKLDRQIKALAERKFAQLVPSDQKALMNETKKSLVALYDEGSVGAKAYTAWINKLSRETKQYGLTATEVEEKVARAIEAGIIIRKGSEGGKPASDMPKGFEEYLKKQQALIDAKALEAEWSDIIKEKAETLGGEWETLAQKMGLYREEQKAIQDIAMANQALFANNLEFQLMQIDLQVERFKEMKLNEVAINQFAEDAKRDAVIRNLEEQSALYNSFMAGYDQFVNTMVDTEMRKEEKIKRIQEAAKNAFVRFLADQLKEYITNLIAQQVIAKAGEATAVTSAVITGTAIASAYAVPASLAATASFGAAAASGTAAIAASVAATKAMAVALAEGGKFTTKGPQLLLVGEAGKEHVSVTPVENSNLERADTKSVINVNISGGVVNDDYVRNTLIPALNKANSFGS